MSNLYKDPASGNTYAGIITALQAVAAESNLPVRSYESNFKGVIEAILSLRRLGEVPSGELPPGWKPEIDGDGNVIGGDWEQYPQTGALWFDTRQGRLFTWQDDGYYQCNGADGLTIVGPDAPDREVEGGLWYNTLNNNLYLYDGNTWSIVGGDAAVSTATLPLSNATTSTFMSNRPYLPSTDNLATQENMNIWTHSALLQLEQAIQNIPDPPEKLYMEETPPAQSTEGDFWYDTANLRLLVKYNGAYVPTAIPLSSDEDFEALTSTVSINHQSLLNSLSQLQSRLTTQEGHQHHTYTVSTDKHSYIHKPAQIGVYLGNENNEFDSVKFKGTNGVVLTSTLDEITFDTGDLDNRIQAIEDDYLVQADLTTYSDKDASLQQQIDAIDYVPTDTYNQLAAQVSLLPTTDDVNTRLSTSGGHMHGDISMNNNLITGLPQPQTQSGAANKSYVDELRDYVDVTFLTKEGSVLTSTTVENTTGEAGFDFSGSAAYGKEAFKFKSAVGNNTATFGTTDEYWEYAWEFDSNEDFCWKSSGSKKVSINKDGLTASKLTIGSFQPNTVDGTVVTNKIDVGEQLTAYKNALDGVRSALQSSTTFDEFKSLAVTALTGI